MGLGELRIAKFGSPSSAKYSVQFPSRNLKGFLIILVHASESFSVEPFLVVVVPGTGRFAGARAGARAPWDGRDGRAACE
jgi:hypothetical protein